jgi:predicted Zn-dependent protease
MRRIRFSKNPVRVLRYAAGMAAFACALGVWPAAVSRDSQMSPPVRHAVATSSAKGDFLSAERREEMRVLEANGGVYQDGQLQALVELVVERLTASSDRPDLRYRVVILNSSAVNAFSLPSGRLYVTRGLLALANDASELAAVLSHEIGHVTARHALIRETARPAASGRAAADAFSDPQFGALAFAGSTFSFAGFSRSQELEADGVGARISSRAGYDTFGAVRFLNSMTRNAQMRPAGPNDAIPRYVNTPSSHPATADRSSIALVNARQYSAPGVGDRDAAMFLANVDGLVYGEDPGDGVVRGRQFMHPKRGFAFTAPQGFALYRSGQAVVGLRGGGSEMLRLDVVPVPADQSLSEYLASGWMENLDPGSIEEVSVNSLAAATATAEGGQWSFRIVVVRLDKEVVQLIFAAKPGTRELDRVFRELAGSFRPMSPSELEATKPLRLRIVAVQPGETAEKLAKRMAVVDRPLERFLVLNGLTPGQALKAGDRVKLVTYDGHIRPPGK